MPGFGLTQSPENQWATDTHFDRRARLARLIPALVNLNKTFGVGVDEGATFYVNGLEGLALGRNGVFIVDMRTAVVNQTSKYFEVKGVRVHYLTAGDTYNLATNVLTSSKPQIKTPKYIGYSDSTDITSKY